DDLIAQPGAGRDHDLRGGQRLPLVLVEQLLERIDAGLALGLPRPGRHADPLQLALEGALARGLLLLLQAQALPLLLEPGRVVPLPRDPLATVQLENPLRHVVEEVAV